MNLLKIASLCVIVIFACRGAASGCSMTHIDPIELGTTNYVFTGTVVDIGGDVEFPDPVGPSAGLIIKPEGIVSVPQTARRYEIYIFGVGSMCETTGISAEWLSKVYPKGAKVRVVATRLNRFGGTHNGNIVLTAFAPTDISRNDERSRSSAALEPVFNYRAHHDRIKHMPPANERDTLFSYYLQRSHFEFWKDLVRLDRAESREQKTEILQRLVYTPITFDHQGYLRLLKKYVKRKDLIDQIVSRRIRWMQQLSF